VRKSSFYFVKTITLALILTLSANSFAYSLDLSTQKLRKGEAGSWEGLVEESAKKIGIQATDPKVQQIKDHFKQLSRSSTPILGARLAKNKIDKEAENLSHQVIILILHLESKLSDNSYDVQCSAITALGKIYVALINQGKNPSLKALESKLFDTKWYRVRFSAIIALGSIYLALINQGKNPDLSALESKLLDFDHRVKELAATTLNSIKKKSVSINEPKISDQGKITPEVFESKLSDDDVDVRSSAITTLGQFYLSLINQGENPSLSALESKLSDPNQFVCCTAITTLGQIYLALINQGKIPSLSLLESKLLESDNKIWELTVTVLAPIYTLLFHQGKVTFKTFESKLSDPNGAVRSFAINTLGSICASLINQGKNPSLNLFESRLFDDRQAREFVIAAFGQIYVALINQGKLLDEDWVKYELWTKENLAYEESILEDYLNADHAEDFIFNLKQKANETISQGFDPKDSKALVLAFVALRISDIDISFEKFKERMDVLTDFETKHAGYFQNLFTKTKGLRSIQLDSRGATQLDTQNVDGSVLDKHLSQILEIKQTIDSFDWLTNDFPNHKFWNLQSLYYQFKKKEALEKGQIKAQDHFKVNYPSDEAIKKELLSDKKKFYSFIFEQILLKFADQTKRNLYLRLLKDLILSEILEDQTLKNEISSQDPERKIQAFKTIYEDYKNHLPNSLGKKVEDIKGLEKHFEDFTKPLYQELQKAVLVKTSSLEGYTLIPQGFLSIFRGRANIIDCSFDMDKGKAFTRAMHEDTSYYFVYKGKELKGYIGLMMGKDGKNNKILTIDTINSPSLDGEELLTNLFEALHQLALEQGAIGIALPQDIDPSFNFENQNTISEMKVYKEAKKVKITPLHPESWKVFTAEFGEDEYNSIEEGKFKLLKLPKRGARLAAHPKSFFNLYHLRLGFKSNDFAVFWIPKGSQTLSLKDRELKDTFKVLQSQENLSKRLLAQTTKALSDQKFVLISIAVEGRDVLKFMSLVQELKTEIQTLNSFSSGKLHVFVELVSQAGERLDIFSGFKSDPIPTKNQLGNQKLERIYTGSLKEALVTQAKSLKAGFLGTQEPRVDQNHTSFVAYKPSLRAAILTAISDSTQDSSARQLLQVLTQTSIGTLEFKLIKEVPSDATVKTYLQKNLFVKVLAQISRKLYESALALRSSEAAV
jgi:HEAT repeat protein